jgi:hypothetical protein
MLKKGYYSLFLPLWILVFFSSAVGQSDKQTISAVLVDNTGSMTTQFPQVLMFADVVVKRIRQRGPISVFEFEKKEPLAVIGPGTGWTQDEATLENHIHSLSIIRGSTALFEAIESIADELISKANSDKAVFAEKALILIIDGDDRMERGTGVMRSSQDEDDRRRRARDQLIKKLKQMGITVYAIGLTKELSADSLIRVSPREKAELFLTKITKQTGGRAVFPRAKKFDTEGALDELFGP